MGWATLWAFSQTHLVTLVAIVTPVFRCDNTSISILPLIGANVPSRTSPGLPDYFGTMYQNWGKYTTKYIYQFTTKYIYQFTTKYIYQFTTK
jgi:hypothetical protein